MFQIARSSLKCWELLRNAYKQNTRRDHPLDEDLFKLLEDLLRISGPTFIILDALDECRTWESGGTNLQAHLFVFLRKLYDLEIPGLRLLITSRPEAEINDFLEHYKLTISFLTLNDDNRHAEDLRRYISIKLLESKFSRWELKTREKAEDLFNAKANGM